MLEWFAQSQDLLWEDTSLSDHSEEPQENATNKTVMKVKWKKPSFQ